MSLITRDTTGDNEVTGDNEATPDGQLEDQPGWQVAAELLKAGQYERVITLLHEAHFAGEQANGALLFDILVAASRICLVCHQCQAEADWHRQAYQEAARREHELRQQLLSILDAVGKHGGLALPDEQSPPAPSAAGPDHNHNNHNGGAAPISSRSSRPPLHLWQRVQSLLVVRGPDPSLLETEAPTEPVTLPGAFLAELASALTVPALQEEYPEPRHPALAVYCLGPFRAYQHGVPVAAWSNGKGKAIFKYLVANRGRPTSKDVLMDLFWRNADPDAARNNLNVALHGLRQSLRDGQPDSNPILFEDDAYLLNPALAVWVDVEEFALHYEAGQSLERAGKPGEAMLEYNLAEALYQGDFLEEDLYDDWPMARRESLKDSYFFVLDRMSRFYLEQGRYDLSIQLSQKILAKDDCREDVHVRLMRCYSRQGQPHLALRQYQLCVEALARTLDIPPAPETVALYDQIRRREAV